MKAKCQWFNDICRQGELAQADISVAVSVLLHDVSQTRRRRLLRISNWLPSFSKNSPTFISLVLQGTPVSIDSKVKIKVRRSSHDKIEYRKCIDPESNIGSKRQKNKDRHIVE